MRPDNEPPRLLLKSISKRFGSVYALTNIDLAVGAGEVVGIVGDNGSGKSTLLKVLAGVYNPTVGDIEIEGKAVKIKSPREAQRAGVEVVYQDVTFCENLSVLANLWLGREQAYPLIPKFLRGLNFIEMERRSVEALAEVGLQLPSVRVPLSALSSEQRQLLAFARTLLGQPKIILLDEPTAVLGVAQTGQFLNWVTRLKVQGITVIVSSHALQEIFEIADRIAVMRAGRIVDTFETDNTRPEQILASITGADIGAFSR